MINLKTELIRAFKKLLNYRRTLLPLGRTEFNKWVSDMIFTYDLTSRATENDIIWVLTNLVMQSRTSLVSNREIYLQICKAIANQVAGTIFNETKTRQIEEEKKARELEAQKKLEATTPNLSVVSNGTTQEKATSTS